MPPTPTLVQPLPLDADGILALAARSMFQLFSTMSQGMFLADRAGRIVWVNEGYQRFLPEVMLAVVIVLIVLVQIVQSTGDWIAQRVNKRNLKR